MEQESRTVIREWLGAASAIKSHQSMPGRILVTRGLRDISARHTVRIRSFTHEEAVGGGERKRNASRTVVSIDLPGPCGRMVIAGGNGGKCSVQAVPSHYRFNLPWRGSRCRPGGVEAFVIVAPRPRPRNGPQCGAGPYRAQASGNFSPLIMRWLTKWLDGRCGQPRFHHPYDKDSH